MNHKLIGKLDHEGKGNCSVCGANTRFVFVSSKRGKPVPCCVMSLIRTGSGSKYRNVPTTIDGVSFHSKKEAKRWEVLKEMEKAKEISNLRRQVSFKFKVGKDSMMYRADFVYEKDGEIIVEDVKGMKHGTPYALFRAKKMLMKVLYGIEVQEI